MLNAVSIYIWTCDYWHYLDYFNLHSKLPLKPYIYYTFNYLTANAEIRSELNPMEWNRVHFKSCYKFASFLWETVTIYTRFLWCFLLFTDLLLKRVLLLHDNGNFLGCFPFRAAVILLPKQNGQVVQSGVHLMWLWHYNNVATQHLTVQAWWLAGERNCKHPRVQNPDAKHEQWCKLRDMSAVASSQMSQIFEVV